MTDEQLAVLDAGLCMVQEGPLFNPLSVPEPIRGVIFQHFSERGVVGNSYVGRKIVVAAIARTGYFAEPAE
jgi:hypothetical protein